MISNNNSDISSKVSDEKIEGAVTVSYIGIHNVKHEGTSIINIRYSHNPLRLFKPVAIVECGGCGNEYKEKLSLELSADYYYKQNRLECKECGNADIISYEKGKCGIEIKI